jgi:hypothetical protein
MEFVRTAEKLPTRGNGATLMKAYPREESSSSHSVCRYWTRLEPRFLSLEPAKQDFPKQNDAKQRYAKKPGPGGSRMYGMAQRWLSLTTTVRHILGPRILSASEGTQRANCQCDANTMGRGCHVSSSAREEYLYNHGSCGPRR